MILTVVQVFFNHPGWFPVVRLVSDVPYPGENEHALLTFFFVFHRVVVSRGWVVSAGVIAVRWIISDIIGTPTQATEGGDTASRDHWHLIFGEHACISTSLRVRVTTGKTGDV